MVVLSVDSNLPQPPKGSGAFPSALSPSLVYDCKMSLALLPDNEATSLTTKLMTLVNVSAAAPGKRKYDHLTEQETADGGLRLAARYRMRSNKRHIRIGTGATLSASSSVPVTSTAESGPGALSYDDAFASDGLRASVAATLDPPSMVDSSNWHGTATSRNGLAISKFSLAATLQPDGRPLSDKAEEPRSTDLAMRLHAYKDLVDCTVDHRNRGSWRSAVANHAMAHIQALVRWVFSPTHMSLTKLVDA